MSYAYTQRKKAIKRAKKRLAAVGRLEHGSIPANVFTQMQHDWHRKIIGPPIGTLADFLGTTGEE